MTPDKFQKQVLGSVAAWVTENGGTHHDVNRVYSQTMRSLVSSMYRTLYRPSASENFERYLVLTYDPAGHLVTRQARARADEATLLAAGMASPTDRVEVFDTAEAAQIMKLEATKR